MRTELAQLATDDDWRALGEYCRLCQELDAAFGRSRGADTDERGDGYWVSQGNAISRAINAPGVGLAQLHRRTRGRAMYVASNGTEEDRQLAARWHSLYERLERIKWPTPGDRLTVMAYCAMNSAAPATPPPTAVEIAVDASPLG